MDPKTKTILTALVAAILGAAGAFGLTPEPAECPPAVECPACDVAPVDAVPAAEPVPTEATESAPVPA